MVSLRELVTVEHTTIQPSIYHKNLRRVVYVTGDLAGAEESPVYAILKMNQALDHLTLPEGYTLARYNAVQPESTDHYSMKWDGEWHITIEVFRDLGPGLRRRADSDLCACGGLVPLVPGSADDYGAHPIDVSWDSACARNARRIFHRNFDDRLHRWGRNHRAQFDHPC